MTVAATSVQFRVVLRDDDAQERLFEARIDCQGAADQDVSLFRSVPGSLAEHSTDYLAGEAAVAIERWSATNEVRPQDVLRALNAELPASQHRPCASRTMLGIPPLTYPAQGSLGGKKHARTEAEVPPVPDPAGLSEIGRESQVALQRLIDRSGGRLGLLPGPDRIAIGDLDLLADMFTEWAEQYGERQSGGIAFGPQPGLWHALDRLVPLQDPNRWDPLRKAVIQEVQSRGWQRSGGVRGSNWWIPDEPGG